ncbi:FbpB family small basic protein [Bacillus dakarensis]|uniref:FbpB family small basic protein n=1 Tax=Robertmurraya dakarensis TaxID=1926278 RepID=UPI001115926D|nr:FbpB family small basic protein [Bacillus dakarensis]
MSRYSHHKNLKDLIKKNIRDLQQDSKLLDKIEERIESKFMKESAKIAGMEK